MKLSIFIIMVLLFLFSLYSYINIHVSIKYEVEGGRILTKIDKSLTKEQKTIQLRNISELEKDLKIGLQIHTGLMILSIIVLLSMSFVQIKKVRLSNSKHLTSGSS